MNSSAFPMQDNLRKKYASYGFLFGLFLLAASLPYSKVTISIAEIILFLSWLVDGDLPGKLKKFFSNRIALVVSSLFLLHVLGMLYTSDLKEGYNELKGKVPLILLPLLFSSCPPLSKQMLDRILGLFTLATVVSTLICFTALLGITGKKVLDPQGASLFMSHIRFGLLISMSVFLLGYFFDQSSSNGLKILFMAVIMWLIAFLIMMESAAGLICTVAGGIALAIRYILNSKHMSLKIGLGVILALCILGTIQLYRSASEEFILKPDAYNEVLLSQTKAGNPYEHDTLNGQIENGYYIWLNFCDKEMSESWNNRSELDYSGQDKRGNELKFTLARFLTSKAATKDAEGVNGLSDEEVQAIEKGVPNVHYVGLFNPTARLQKVMWEFHMYLDGANPSGHSATQRLEFWRAAIGIIKDHPFTGVGTGDMQQAFNEQYDKMNSWLEKEWRLRSHNQYLAIGTAFGIPGIIWFLVTLFYPIFRNKNYNNYLYLTFCIIALLSMISEDTLESQSGVTFFAFFNSFFLFLRRDNQTA